MPSPTPTQIGRYKVLRVLGEGGMGAVYLAEDPAIDRLVAIKLMRKGFDDGQMRDRFTREAKSVGRLRHPNIVMVFDVGEHEGDPFIAMEYVEGDTLSGVIRGSPDMPVGRKIEIMEAVCAGLYYAHRQNIVHRDIKPPNIMVDTEGGVKILDFGIARGPASGNTVAGTVIGTLNYMAPEQLAGKRVDHRADIFAVGALFYELLSARQAFPGDISSGVLHQILIGQPESLATVVPGLHPDLVAAVERCLRKDPEERYDDLEILRRALVGLKSQAWAAEAVESTIKVKKLEPPADAGTSPRPARTPGPDTRAELIKMRHERIEQQMAEARAALARQEYARALEACQQALIIDPENHAAQDLQDAIRGEQHAQPLLTEARAELGRGAVDSAAALVERALALAPDFPPALELRRAVAEAKRRIEAEAARQRAIHDALGRGQQALNAGELDRVTAALAELSQLDPANAGAARLTRDLEVARAARKRAEEDARARSAVDQARRLFADGRHDQALTLLRDHRPAHAVVDDALMGLERERAEITRREIEARRKAEDDARRKAEEDAQRRAQEEAARRRAQEDAQRRAQEEEAKRRAVEAQRRAQEEETKRAAAAEEVRKATERQAEERRSRERLAADERARAAKAGAEAEEFKTVILPGGPQGRLPDQKPPRVEAPPVVDVAQLEAKTVLIRPDKLPGKAPQPTPVLRAPESRPVQRAPEPPPGVVVPPVRPYKLPLPALIAAAVVVLGLGGWLLYRAITGGETPGGGGGVVTQAIAFEISPWASIESITRKADNQPVAPGPWTTPCVVRLAPGEYHVVARSQYFPTADEFDLTVVAGQDQHVRRVLPGLNPEDEARKIIKGR